MVSGVWVRESVERNCERRTATSEAVKPLLRRRSKPWGAAGGVVSAWEVDGETLSGGGARVEVVEEEEARDASAAEAAVASAVSSVGVRAEPMEQWM